MIRPEHSGNRNFYPIGPSTHFADRAAPLYRARVTRTPRPPWPPEPAVFLDLDGTLIEIARRPDAVRRTDRLDALLARLPAATGNAVAVVSGRGIADVDRLLTPFRLPVAGIHGLERRSADGKLHRVPVDLDWIHDAHRAMEHFVAEHPGLLLENKDVSLALHYRGRPELEDTVQQFVAELDLPAAAERLRGRKVIEIKPGQMNKGTAIRAFMSEPPFAGRTPVFAGDDVTDESGFAVVNELGGVSVKVGDGDTAANWSLPGVSHVLEWLGDAMSGDRSSVPASGSKISGRHSARPTVSGPHPPTPTALGTRSSRTRRPK